MSSRNKTRFASLAFALAVVAQTASAQTPRPEIAEPETGGIMFAEVAPSPSDRSMRSAPTAAELRQQRAQLQARQRMLRMERNLWAGFEPLRPNWNSIPMMTSRYSLTYRTIVPIYIYNR